VSEMAERDAKVEQARKHFEQCKDIHHRVFDNMAEWQHMEAKAREVLEDARAWYMDALHDGEKF